MKRIYDRLFNVPLGALVKSICFCLGDTNKGKSTIVKAGANAFVLNFVETFNAKNLLLKTFIQMKQLI